MQKALGAGCTLARLHEPVLLIFIHAEFNQDPEQLKNVLHVMSLALNPWVKALFGDSGVWHGPQYDARQAAKAWPLKP